MSDKPVETIPQRVKFIFGGIGVVFLSVYVGLLSNAIITSKSSAQAAISYINQNPAKGQGYDNTNWVCSLFYKSSLDNTKTNSCRFLNNLTRILLK